MLSHIQKLNNDKKFPGWLRDVHSRSSSLGKHLHVLGLYTLTATDAEWASVATNIDDEGNIAARPTYPEPDALPLVATNSVIARFNIDMAKFISHNTLSSQLKEEIITSIGTPHLYTTSTYWHHECYPIIYHSQHVSTLQRSIIHINYRSPRKIKHTHVFLRNIPRIQCHLPSHYPYPSSCKSTSI